MEEKVTKFSQQFTSNQTAEWRAKYCEYDHLAHMLRLLKKRNDEYKPLLNNSPHLVTEEQVLVKFEAEMMKVSDFYEYKIKEYKERFEKLQIMGAYVCNIPAFRDTFQNKKPDKIMLKDVTDNFRRFKVGEETMKVLLKKGITQLYRGLLMLYNFALLNNTAFLKLIEKFEVANAEPIQHDLYKELNETDFSTAVETIRLRKQLETIYSSAFLGNAKPSKARKELTKRRHDQRDLNMYLIGFCIGVAVVLLTVWILSVIRTRLHNESVEDSFLILLPIFRLVLIPTLAIGLYGIDTLIWHRSRINYVYIYEYDPDSALAYRSLFLWFSMFIVVFSIALFLGYDSLILGDLFSIPDDIGFWLFPMLMIIFFFSVLCCPFNIFWRPSRLCWVRNMIQVFIAPFGHVGFQEFFVGDVFTSMAKTFWDLQYTLCFFLSGSFLSDNNNDFCSNINFYIAPLYAAAPLYWRFCQCSKRYYLTKDKFHLANAFKYGSASSIIFFSAIMGYQKYMPGEWPPSRIGWLISWILSSFLLYWWDVYYDWGLFRRNPKNWMLREELVWKNKKWFYWYAILSNFVGRYFWAITITPFIILANMQPEILDTIACIVEINRRFTWLILRIENEHLNNVGEFREIKFIPLPFDVNKTDEVEVIPEDPEADNSDFTDRELNSPVLGASPMDFIYETTE